jgi:hypothetical protein
MSKTTKAIILQAVDNAVFSNQSKCLYNVLNEPERETGT